MPNSSRSSVKSPPCRCDWKPAALIAAALLAGTLLAMLSLLLSDLPPAWRLPACTGVAAWGIWRTRTWLAQPPRSLRFDRAQAALWVDGVAVQAPRLHWRTNLLVVRWGPPGARQACALLPMQLSPQVLRELRQWPRTPGDSPGRATVAP